MENFIIITILVVIVGFAVRYIYKAKKSGHKCIGCPEGASCNGNCGCSGGAGGTCSCGCGGKD